MNHLKRISATLIFYLAIGAIGAAAQTNEFTYQGKLTDSLAPSATYDFEFRLCASESDCSSPLEAKQRLNVAVTNGVFTVKLDFAAAYFSGADRFLEIRVRRGSNESWSPLNPRQKITSSPYAIKSLNAANADNSSQLGGVAANQYVQTNDARLSDARNPLPNSANYIHNTVSPQASSNFNISGTGRANIFNAVAQYDINGERALTASGSQGFLSTFVGIEAGNTNPSGGSNSFFGFQSGYLTNTGFENSFFGSLAGKNNSNGIGNSYFGTAAGGFYTQGNNNSFFGIGAGLNQTSTTGSNNSFFGAVAGVGRRSGDNNSFFGANANGSPNLTNGTAIGYRAYVGQDNSLVLGGIAGFNGATASTNVGIGLIAPSFKLHINDESNTGLRVQTNAAGGKVASFGGNGAFEIDSPGFPGGRLRIAENGAFEIGGGAFRVAESGDVSIGFPFVGGNLTVNGNTVLNTLTVANGVTLNVLGSAGGTPLCRNASNQISDCSSSLRYKTNIKSFASGLSLVKQMRPVTFDWKQGGTRDVGFGAEDVARINPMFVTYNSRGEVEGVKYDRLSVAFVNAFREQQAQIEQQQKQLENQQQQINELKGIVCQIKPEATVCKK